MKDEIGEKGEERVGRYSFVMILSKNEKKEEEYQQCGANQS